MVTERILSLFSGFFSQFFLMPLMTPSLKINLSEGTSIGVFSAAGAASSMGASSTGAVSSSSTPATGTSTTSPSSAVSPSPSAARMPIGSRDSIITNTRAQVRSLLPSFFSDIKKPPSCRATSKKGGNCIWQPAAVRCVRRLDPWLCDTGFRRLCLCLSSCSSASRTDKAIFEYFILHIIAGYHKKTSRDSKFF